VTGPLVVEFEVAAEPEHAFAVWTERCASWWPAGHTISRGPDAIMFEPHAGGRIFERAPDGTEHEWGAIVAWDPPTRLSYLWHLFFDPSEATEVQVTFRSPGAGRTIVRIEQSGWERLGEAGPPRRTRTVQVWRELSGVFRSACETG
jgi:uncharacterized protein YndB with AHSA1/START domain